jgi:ribosome-binding factor A
MKHTPQIQFVYDETPERGMRINELLRAEAGEEPREPEEEAS